jgi:transitional endoplasmic reticulum ATPase
MSLYAYVIRAIVRLFLALVRGVRDSAVWVARCAKDELIGRNSVWKAKLQPRPFLSLILVIAPISVLMVIGPPEWFLNPPAMVVGAMLLVFLVKGPLRDAPQFLRKLVKMGASTLVAWALLIAITWKPLWNSFDRSGQQVLTVVVAVVCWVLWPVSILWIATRKEKRVAALGPGPLEHRASPPPQEEEPVRNVPRLRFADLGGMEREKEEIGRIVRAKLDPKKQYGEPRNGILLFGPQGTGKSLLAEATAGEFHLNFEKLVAHGAIERWIGATGENIRAAFRKAARRRPVLFFIDEIDSLGAGRHLGGDDSGGGGRELNNITVSLMGCVDEYRALDGFVLMAATNRLDDIDPALTRPKRFDLKLRVDLPDEAERLKILEAQLGRKPWKKFPLEEFARLTPGASASKLAALVDDAAAIAAEKGRKIDAQDLQLALERAGGKDRPLTKEVGWDDVVIEDSVEKDLKGLIRLLEDPGRSRELGLRVPTGLLLVGPPGTGKTLIARLIACQTKRSFYDLTAADVLGGGVGSSVKRVAQIFGRAKEQNPSLIFMDEIDGLLPAGHLGTSPHDAQLVDQFLSEISNLEAEHNVFLVGTTNRPENIDPRVLRGGRFSEKITLNPPGAANREKLVRRYLTGISLDNGMNLVRVSELLAGLAPADIEAICHTAKRMAFNRSGEEDKLPPLTSQDFTQAMERVLGHRYESRIS